MSEHTKEPWTLQPGYLTVYSLSNGDSGITIAIAKILEKQVEGFEQAKENGRRIVACVNACAGLKTGGLEKGGTGCLSDAVINMAIKEANRRCV